MMMTKRIIHCGLIILILLFAVSPAYSEKKTQPVTDTNISKNTHEMSRLSTLRDVNESILSLSTELKEKEKSFSSVITEEKKKLIQAEVDRINALIDTREKEFVSIVMGDDIDTFQYTSGKAFSLRDELQDIIRPAVEELKRLTKHPRDIEKLRREISFYEKKVPVIKNILENTSRLNRSNSDPDIRKKLELIEKTWSEKEKEYSRQLSKLQFQISQKQISKKPYLRTIQESAAAFFKSRGLHIIMSSLLFISILVLFRFLQRRFSRYIKKNETTSFFHKAMKVFFHVFTLLAALSSSVLLLYSLGDWVLLSIVLILLAGLLWSARQGFAGYWEQIRLLLDIGSVRQGERLIYDGIPWQVRSVNLMTILKNPVLQGGMIRLPLKSLVGLQSRPFHPDEPWFPSRPGDYVMLNDKTWGKVLTQSPEAVVMEVLGGSRKTYPSTDFFQKNPVNQSLNTFAVPVIFGIDYAEQPFITSKIPLKIQTIVSEKLKQESFGEYLTKVTVQFNDAGESSLNLFVYVTFDGKAAEYYFSIGRAVQRILVDACTGNNWGIPFSQLTLHLPDTKSGNGKQV